MNPEFRYSVVSTNLDGDKSTARFLNAASAFNWANRLKDEGTPLEIRRNTETGEVKLTLADLKKEAGPLKSNKRKSR